MVEYPDKVSEEELSILLSTADKRSGILVRSTGGASVTSLTMLGLACQAEDPPDGRDGEQLCSSVLPVFCLLTQQMPWE